MHFDIQTFEALDKFVLYVSCLNLQGASIGLSGNLGAGKTTFVRGLVKQLGGNSEDVSSPTYVLEHRYALTGAITGIEHWDLYRLAHPNLELFEPVDANSLRLIEWADKFEEILLECDWLINFVISADGKRAVELIKQ